MGTIHATRPKLRITAYPFVSSHQSRQNWLTSDERRAFQNPVSVPMHLIGDVNIADRLDGGSFSLSVPGGAQKSFRLPEMGYRIRLEALLDRATVLEFHDGEHFLFAGYIAEPETDVFPERAINDLMISGSGLERAAMEQTIFVDFSQKKSENPNLQRVGAVASSSRTSFEASLSDFIKTIKSVKSPELIINALANATLERMSGGGKYGGLNFSSLLDIKSGMSSDSYTKNFHHVLSFIKLARFGSEYNLWNLMEGIAKAPLYELFVNCDKKPVYIGAGITASMANKQNKGILVFRKTPFKFLNSDSIDPALLYTITPDRVIRMSSRSSISDIYTGVHVRTGITDQVSSLGLNPPTYSPWLVELKGQRVFPIVLDGISFPEKDEKERSSLRNVLKEIQREFFKTFGSGDRVETATLQNHYEPGDGLQKGKILRFENLDASPEMRQFDRNWYINGVSRHFQPADATVTQTVELTWGRKSFRRPVNINPANSVNKF